MEGEGKLNICTRMHPDPSWWVVLHTRSRLIEPFSGSCVPALLSQSHAKGSHAFWPRNQKCTSRWWWIYNRYHVNTLCQVLKTLPKDPCLCSFFPSPDCLHWPLVCQELMMDPHGTRHHRCILPESRPFQDEWRWRKWRKFWECCSLELWMIGGTRIWACTKTSMEFWKAFKSYYTLPHGPGNPSRMVVYVCCQQIRHGWILMWKQNSLGLTVFSEHCLVERGLKSKYCSFCNLHSACSRQRPYFDHTVHFILVCLCSTHKGHNFPVWCDTDKPKWFKGLQWNLQ